MQDATVQSIPQTSQVPAAVAPSSYVAPAPVNYQAAPSQAPVAYQVGTSYPQAVPQAAPSYQSAPTQYAPQSPSEAPASNPWESAFNKVVNLLSAPVQSPFQGQPSQTTQYAPANYGQQYSNQVTPQSAPQTWSRNQAYSPNSSQISSAISSTLDGLSPTPEVQSAIADYLQLNAESRHVVDAYGWNAPAVLNNYALQLEGMLDSAVAWGSKAQETLQRYANFSVAEHQENLAYNEILTNPDVLSDYTLKFFGPEGPYPVYEDESQLETRGYPTSPINAALGQFPAPPAAAAPQQPENFWGSFKQQMDVDPAQAWRLLNQAQPQVVANKLFVME
jgi:hypothetical protein